MQNPLTQEVHELANALHKRSIEIRRDLHRIPETAWQEVKTSAYLKKKLYEKQIKFKSIEGT